MRASSTNSWSSRSRRAPPRRPTATVLEDAIAAVLEGRAENDAFNRLILDARHGPARGRAAPRLVPLSAPGRPDLWPDHGGRRAAPRARRRAGADRPFLRRARSRRHARRRRRAGRQGDRQGARRGLGDRRRPHPARDQGRGRGDAAHQRLHARGRRSAGVQARQPQGARPSRPAAVARDLGLFARASRASICAPARSRAAGCAGPTGATTSAPKSSG